MSFFSKFLGKGKKPGEPAAEHAVIAHFNYGQTDLAPLSALEDELIKAIAQASAGEFDGNEVATDGSDGFLYMYGPDADGLYRAIEPVLAASPLMRGATVTLRFGPPGEETPTRVISLPS